MKKAETIEEKNAKIIEKYISGLPTLKPRTVKKYWVKLPIIAARLKGQKGKTLDKISKKELKKYVESINGDPDYEESTKWDYRKFTKKFFRDTKSSDFVSCFKLGRPCSNTSKSGRTVLADDIKSKRASIGKPILA